MKRNIFLQAGLCILIAFTTACSNQEFDEGQACDKQITMTASDFIYADNSRTNINVTEKNGGFTWAKNDTVGVFPNEGTQAAFPMINGAGTKTAYFDGGGWALKPSAKYMAYYPMKGQFYLDKTTIPINLENQVQIGNASTAHLGKYDYMAAVATTPEDGNVNFNFKHLCTIVELTINVPNKGDLTSVKLSSDEAIFTTKGTIDLTSNNPQIISSKKLKSITLDIKGITTSADKEFIKTYLMLAPTDLTGKTVTVTIVNNGVEHNAILAAQMLQTGKIYKYFVSFETLSPVTKEIKVQIPGSLGELVNKDFANISKIKIIGLLNGKDINTLNKMLKYKLSQIDLYEANFINDGTFYQNNFFNVKTKRDTITEYMFYGALSLEHIILPKDIRLVDNGSFQNCKKLRKIQMFNKVEEISDFAFSGCESLEEFVFPHSVTRLSGQDIFSYCSNLRNITLSNNVELIPYRMFDHCSKLTKLVYPEKVTRFASAIHDGCTNLESIKILSKKRVHFDMDFTWYCKKLKELHFSSSEPPTFSDSELNNIFGSEIINNCVLYIPNGALSNYMNSKMKYFKHIKEE